jgi:hypothetical protein
MFMPVGETEAGAWPPPVCRGLRLRLRLCLLAAAWRGR